MAHLQFTVLLALLAYAIAVTVNDKCPPHLTKNDHLVQFNQNCFEIILDHPGDWYFADGDCKAKRGHLADIHSYSENAFLYNIIQQLGIPNDKGIWIGMTDEPSEGQWQWVSGKPVTFTNWASGQPGVVGGLEDCAVMEFSDGGLWHDYPCHGFLFTTENHGWICEYDIVA